MVTRGKGTILNVTSGVAYTDPLDMGSYGIGYAVGKAGLFKAAGILAVELGDKGITAYNVHPASSPPSAWPCIRPTGRPRPVLRRPARGLRRGHSLAGQRPDRQPTTQRHDWSRASSSAPSATSSPAGPPPVATPPVVEGRQGGGGQLACARLRRRHLLRRPHPCSGAPTGRLRRRGPRRTDPAKTARRPNGLRYGTAAPPWVKHSPSASMPCPSPGPGHARPLAAEAIAAGCHVLCEKPFTLDVSEAEELVRAGEAAGVVTMLGHEFRWSVAQSTMEWALAEGLIGTPEIVRQRLVHLHAPHVSHAGMVVRPRRGGGWLNASGSHRIDALRQWFGEFGGSSAGLTSTSDPPLGVDDTFNIRAAMRNGVDVSLVQSGAAAGPGAGMTRVVGPRTLWAEGDTVHVATDDEPAGRVPRSPRRAGPPRRRGTGRTDNWPT